MMLAADQLAQILAAYGQQASIDQLHLNRRAPRVHQNTKTVIYRPAATAAEAALPVQIRDLSARGCSFTTRQVLPHGSFFVLQFARQDQAPVSVLCTVMHCRPSGDQHRIGAEFTCLVDPRRAAAGIPDNPEELSRIRDSILA